MKKGVLFLFLYSIGLGLAAQTDNFLSFFTATETNGSVFLSWQIQQGNTCNGIKIFRSGNNLDFTQIGEIFGICGSISKPENYSFTDEAPLGNSTNYYRLQFGGGGSTAAAQIDIFTLSGAGYLLFPNPLTQTGRLYFSNKESVPHVLRAFDLQGRLLFEAMSSGNFFDIQNQQYPAGLYKFSLGVQGAEPSVFGTIVFAD